jgi:hypothetical protein
MLPKFTPQGFAVAQTPPHIAKKLQDAVAAGIRNWSNLPLEKPTIVYNRYGVPPKWLDLKELGHEVHHELLPLHEAWVGGMKLIPTKSYGVRLYQNGSSLMMHCDRVSPVT